MRKLVLAFLWRLLLLIAIGIPIGVVLFLPTMVFNYFNAIIDCFRGRLPAAINLKPANKEPAYRSYFFGKAWGDLKDIIVEGWRKSNRVVIKVEQHYTNDLSDLHYISAIETISAIAEGIAYAVGAGPFVLLALINMMIVALICLTAYLVALYLRLAETFSKLVRAISYECPACYKKIGLLVYLCPECGAQHKGLIPGQFGIMKRKCSCLKMIPTSDLLGRAKLEKFCPHCGFPIKGGDAKTFHIALIGGVSAGKSCYIKAAVRELIKDLENNGKRTYFPYDEDEINFNKWRHEYDTGVPPEKTQERLPKSLNLMVREQNGYQYNLYIYDAAGELFTDNSSILYKQGFLVRAQAIIFVIDPFSIEGVKQDVNRHVLERVSPSESDPKEILDHFLEHAKRHRYIRQLRKKAVAVVISKADELDVSKIPNSNIKEWLITKGMKNMVVEMNLHFKQSEYYLTSSLGHSIDQHARFIPDNVLGPIKQILESQNIEMVAKKEHKRRSLSTRAGTLIGYSFATGVYAVFCFLVFTVWKIH